MCVQATRTDVFMRRRRQMRVGPHPMLRSWASTPCDFPGSLEAVILDGANALSRRSWVEERVRNADVAIGRLDALCEADARCAAAFDNPALIDAAMALFDDGPIQTTFTDPDDPGTTIDVTLTGCDMAEFIFIFIFGFQTGQIQIHSLPAVLDAILASRGATLGEHAMLMPMAVVCSDDPVTQATDLIVEPGASANARACGASTLAQYLASCAAVDVQPLPDSTHVDVTADVPTLILAGALDARTPSIRRALVAEKLPRASIMVFPGCGVSRRLHRTGKPLIMRAACRSPGRHASLKGASGTPGRLMREDRVHISS